MLFAGAPKSLSSDAAPGVGPYSPAVSAQPTSTPASQPGLAVAQGSMSTTPSLLLSGEPSNPPFQNSQSLSASAFTRLLKLGISVTIFSLIGYFSIKSVYPVLVELSKPGSAAAKGEDAPMGVKVLQQTRSVVAKSDANVAYLDAIIENKTIPERPAIALPALPSPPPQPEVNAITASPVQLRTLKNAISQLHVHGVIGGAAPRIIVNGLMVSVGQEIDANLALKFASLDENRRVIVLTDKRGEIFYKSY